MNRLLAGATQLFNIDRVSVDSNLAEILILRAVERRTCVLRVFRLAENLKRALWILTSEFRDNVIAPRVLAIASPHPLGCSLNVEGSRIALYAVALGSAAYRVRVRVYDVV